MRAVRVIVHIVFSSLVHIVQFHSITFTSRARARVPIVTQAGHGRARVISVCLPPARARAQDSRAFAALVEHGNFLLPSQASASLSSQIASKMRASHFSRARADRTRMSASRNLPLVHERTSASVNGSHGCVNVAQQPDQTRDTRNLPIDSVSSWVLAKTPASDKLEADHLVPSRP